MKRSYCSLTTDGKGTLSREFIYLDDAAHAVTRILAEQEIPHLFIGGYAVSLFSRSRIPKDLDVLVREDCTPILLRSSQFSQTAGNRLIYRKDGTDVFIDIMWPQNTHHREFLWIWDFSWPSTSMEEYEKINTKGGFLVPVLHPAVLILTRVLPWYAAESDAQQALYRRSDTDFEDIIDILQWLAHKDLKINFRFFSHMPTWELIKAFGYMFQRRRHKYVRGLLAQCLPLEILRDVLNSLEDNASKERT